MADSPESSDPGQAPHGEPSAANRSLDARIDAAMAAEAEAEGASELEAKRTPATDVTEDATQAKSLDVSAPASAPASASASGPAPLESESAAPTEVEAKSFGDVAALSSDGAAGVASPDSPDSPASPDSAKVAPLALHADEPPPKRHQMAFHWVRDYFLGEDPQFLAVLVPFCFLSMLLFTRHPLKTNFIFDEQEALLANPYVRSVTEAHPKFHWLDAFRRDFWGLGPERSIGSYRPIPNLIWRFLWWCGAREHNPFLHHWVNVLFHGVNGALLTMIMWRITKRKGLSWLAGMFLVASAVLTEAVSGVVGISDVFGTFGCLLALYALTCRMPIMGALVFFGTLFGLYSKESAMICVPMLPLFALATASSVFPDKPRRLPRTFIAFFAAAAAFVLYVESRRRLFPAPIPPDFAKGLDKPQAQRIFAAIMRWYGQPALPKDPLNNPLANADTPHRIAGALRVYFRGLGQVVFPKTLSGDYSAPQEPIPSSLIFPESVLGALCLILPVPFAAYLAMRSSLQAWKARGSSKAVAAGPNAPTSDLRPIVAASLVWVVASYFPVSNIPILLPTVRAERFWYFPVVGTSILLAAFFMWVVDRAANANANANANPTTETEITSPEARPSPTMSRVTAGLFAMGVGLAITLATAFSQVTSHVGHYLVSTGILVFGLVNVVRGVIAGGGPLARVLRRDAAVWACVLFTLYQCVSARLHANDYTTDLTFWDATRKAVPNSAKAHLNYSVMKGARGDLEARRVSNLRALELAPEWPMASIYLADTLCRMHRAEEAWPHYKKGFALASNDVNLLSLGIQCMWDEKFVGPLPKVGEGEPPPTEPPHRAELRALAAQHPGSWLEWLTNDLVANGETHNGVDPKYRPRGYNEGPKE